MPRSLSGRNFLKLLDFTTEEIQYLLELAKDFKRLKRTNTPHKYLTGKNIVLLLVAGNDLGMGVTYLDPASSQMGNKESLEDTAKVLGRMFDGIEYRGFDQDIVEDLGRYAGIPVWNGLTTEFHPTQMLADVLTIEENFGRYKGLKMVFMGDARNNVANSLMVVSAKLGINFVACGPKDNMPDAKLVATCRKIAKENGCTITLTDDVKKGTKNADVIYTDIWVSMGEPAELWEKRIKLLSPYQVNDAVMANANPEAIFLHCLPSFHDLETSVGREIYEKFGLKEMEVTDKVFRSPQSKVFDEAENRMHTIKAVMYATLK